MYDATESRSNRPPRLAVVVVWLTALASATGQAQPPPRGVPGTPSQQLRIGGPVFVPSALSPAATPTNVTVGATAAGAENLPRLLYLEEVSSSGASLGIAAELRDDGEGGDPIARDGRYVAILTLGSAAESERFFLIRTERAADAPAQVTPVTTFAVTNLPIGFPSSDPMASVPTPDGLDQALTNRVVFTTQPGIAPRRVREIAMEVSGELGDTVAIIGYLPGVDGYVASFAGDATHAAIVRVAGALARHAEILQATPTFVARPTVDWWLDTTNVVELRQTLPNPLPVDAPPIMGSSGIGVAVIEALGGLSCTGLPCLLASAISAFSNCSGIYGTPAAPHGTKVANLLAEDPPAPPAFPDENGVAPNVSRLLPLRISDSSQLAQALNCVRDYNASTTTGKVQVVNMSLEAGYTADATLDLAVCNLACANVLMVAAAGNGACLVTAPTPPFPGRYADATNSCSCGAPVRDFMLRAGATTMGNALGDSCGTLDLKSYPGDLYAPGWGIPGPPQDVGTSWAAPLVAGCAAVRGAVDTWNGGPGAWDARETESLLRARTTLLTLPGGDLLDCNAAVRDPYDIVFLLDRSGSMNAGTPTRWAALTAAVNGFTTLLGSSAPAGSRFGLTLFSSGVAEPISGLINIGSGLQGTVNGHLSLMPSGSTGMGPGLQNAMAKLTAADRPRVVVLFTDGDQNFPLPQVNAGGCTYSDSTPVSTPCPGGAGSVKIVSVGVTSPSSPYLTTLQALAQQHRGKLLITDDGTTFDANPSLTPCAGNLTDAFLCAVAPALYGASLQMVTSTLTPFLPGQDLANFEVNRSVAQLAIYLRATGSNPLALRAFLDRLRVTRDGVDVSAYFARTLGVSPTIALLHTDFRAPAGTALPDLAAHGTYVVSFLPDPETDPGLGQQTVRIVAFADDHRLDMQWELAPSAPRVGQPLEPRVRLRWAGEPITDADVVARVLKPGDDLGHLLALHPARVDPSSGPDAPSPGWQKYDLLRRTDAAFVAQLAPNENELQLTHQGDGWYSAPFDPGDVSGVYQVSYSVRADSADFGVIEREAAQSAYVRFGTIDMDSSIVATAVRDNSITLTFKPVTTTGRFLGPGQGAAFGVAGASASLTSVTDHQDGSYTLVLAADPKDDIELSVLDETVYEGPADFQRRRWWWLVLLLLLLAV